jgi:hypothetical protein
VDSSFVSRRDALRTQARQRYRDEIMPEHKKQLVNGMDFPSLGKVVGERTTTMVSGHIGAKRLGQGS